MASPTVSTQSSTTLASSQIVISKPGGVADGMALVVGIGIFDTPNDVSAAPSGWTDLFGKVTSGVNVLAFRAYWKIASSEPSSWTWTFNNNNSAHAHLIVVTGNDTTTPINASGAQANASAANIGIPSVNTSVLDTLLLAFAFKNNSNAITPDAAMTEILDNTVNAHTLEDAFEARNPTGATGTRTATSTGSAVSIGAMIAVAPAVASGASLLAAFP